MYDNGPLVLKDFLGIDPGMLGLDLSSGFVACSRWQANDQSGCCHSVLIFSDGSTV